MTPQTIDALDAAVRDNAITSMRILRAGEVVYTAGPQDVPLPIHSIRKSILNALFGQLITDGRVGLDTTLADLGIDDSPELTATEKSATLEHLLTSRSGVYLPLHFGTSYDVFTNEVADWPVRGSSVPGRRFHYSNWDFNVLGEIYQRVSNIALFVAVDRLVAQPLGFRDWDPLLHSRLHYKHDPLGATPRFPSYSMQLSVRDLAPFGQMYLNGGRWDGQRIVPAEWVQRSTMPSVRTGLPDPFERYGYLWWVTGETNGAFPQSSYSAVGIGGQMLSVIPSHGLIIVAMCDNTSGGHRHMALPKAIMTALLQ